MKEREKDGKTRRESQQRCAPSRSLRERFQGRGHSPFRSTSLRASADRGPLGFRPPHRSGRTAPTDNHHSLHPSIIPSFLSSVGSSLRSEGWAAGIVAFRFSGPPVCHESLDRGARSAPMPIGAISATIFVTASAASGDAPCTQASSVVEGCFALSVTERTRRATRRKARGHRCRSQVRSTRDRGGSRRCARPESADGAFGRDGRSPKRSPQFPRRPRQPPVADAFEPPGLSRVLAAASSRRNRPKRATTKRSP